MTTTTIPDLNHAAAALIERLDEVDNLRGFRERLAKAVFASNCQTWEWPDPQVNAVWVAFGELADAVHARKEG